MKTFRLQTHNNDKYKTEKPEIVLYSLKDNDTNDSVKKPIEAPHYMQNFK